MSDVCPKCGNAYPCSDAVKEQVNEQLLQLLLVVQKNLLEYRPRGLESKGDWVRRLINKLSYNLKYNRDLHEEP